MEDYEGAAVRHFKDAQMLNLAGQLDNAGHLIGFAAECAVKHRISSLRPDANAPHGHFPDLLLAARKHLGARSRYTSMFEVLRSDVLLGWHVNRRYWSTGSTQQAELDSWLSVTKRLLATAGIKGRK